ncbi:coenzyme F420-0:L-glutamate ligase [Brachybacterium sp. DNPG3]
MPVPHAAPAGPVEILPVLGIGEIRADGPTDQHGESGRAALRRLGATLAPALRAAGARPGDVVCISTKIVSKALGLVVDRAERDAAVAAAAVRTVARRRHTRVVTSIVQIASGPVMAAAGVDSSNAPGGPLLLPDDPDACAEILLAVLEDSVAPGLGVLLTDTSSRVWRVGVGDIALGAAGVASLQDLRGGVDGDGRALTVTVRDLADELAAAADLVKGKASRVPVAIVRGVDGAVPAAAASAVGPSAGPAEPPAPVPARDLARTGEDDWFRRPSLESVWQALGLAHADEPVARMEPEPAEERVARALAVAALPRPDAADGRTPRIERPAPDRIVIVPADAAPEDWAAAGALAERVRTALGAESIARPLPDIAVVVGAPPSPTATMEDPR